MPDFVRYISSIWEFKFAPKYVLLSWLLQARDALCCYTLRTIVTYTIYILFFQARDTILSNAQKIRSVVSNLYVLYLLQVRCTFYCYTRELRSIAMLVIYTSYIYVLLLLKAQCTLYCYEGSTFYGCVKMLSDKLRSILSAKGISTLFWYVQVRCILVKRPMCVQLLHARDTIYPYAQKVGVRSIVLL